MDSLNKFWLPFTPNRYFKANPKMLSKANGMYYYKPDGQAILDSCAGLWCVNAGHNQSKIVKAIQSQASELDYAPSFQVSHPLAFKAADKLSSLAPDGFEKVFFTNSGSEAVDTSLKIAQAYASATGEPGRVWLVGREKDYHGVGYGGISIGGLPNNRKNFSLLPNTCHIPHTHNLEVNAFSKGLPQVGAELAEHIKIISDTKGKIAAVIIEPLAGSVGVYLPPEGYLQEVRRYCDETGALLIFDEVITAFGRVGASFAAERFGVIPDIITVAKGLTNGAIPMGAVLVRNEIFNTIVNASPDNTIELFHGYTYSAHPLACSAAIATLELYQQEKLFNKAQLQADIFEQKLHQLRALPHVIDIRNFGMVGAIELASIEGKVGQRAFELFNRCFDDGLLIRITGDTVALSPPLIINEQQIDEICHILSKHIKTLT